MGGGGPVNSTQPAGVACAPVAQQVHPSVRVEQACARWGERKVVHRCSQLMGQRPDRPVEGEGLELAVVLGGLTDPDWLAGGKPPGHAYWARVWAARALLYVWDDAAVPALVAALDDDMWRVRELAAKVVAAREVAQAADRLAGLDDDPVPRVRAAAARALGTVGEVEHADALRCMSDDPDPAVARQAVRAIEELSRRLDRVI